jgi:RNA polymerase sigma-70 factor (family 1)
MQEEQPKGVCEEAGFDAVFHRVAPLLRNFLYYRTGNAEEAEDLMQEAFLKLWDNCAKVLPDKAQSYVFRVAENLFFNQVAHQKVVLKFQSRQTKKEPISDPPQAILEGEEFKEKLEKAIAALPEGARAVFLLNRIEGLKYREIAELLDISVKAVEKRMHRALIDLRKIHQSI